MKQYILTITLNPAIDKSILIPGFSIGSEYRADAVSYSAGGKGVNVSRALKVLGVPAIATGILAGAQGSYLSQSLDREKIPNDFCFTGGFTRTNTTIIEPHTGVATRVLEPGPWVDKRSVKAFLAKYLKLLAHCRMAVLSGSLSPGIPSDFYAILIALAKKRNIPALLDTSGIPLKHGIKAGPFMCKPNLQEARFLLGHHVGPARLGAALHRLREVSGSQIVSITCGSLGAAICDDRGMLRGVPEKVGHANCVGCGDVFIAGFIASFLRRDCLRDNLRFAIACGTANSLDLVPGFFRKADALKIFKKVRILPFGHNTHHKRAFS